jgi:hypothetical protein
MRHLTAALLLPLAACSIGGSDDAGAQSTGQGGQRAWQLEGFEKVELAGRDDVEVRVGQGFSVRAEGPSEVLDQLRIDKDGDTLEIGRRNGSSSNTGKARILVTLPRMVGASMAGSGSMRIDRAGGARFETEVAGSGTVQIGQIQADELEIEIAGSGTVRAAGAAKSLTVEIAGSGNVEAAGLTANAAEVSIAGSGDVRATVNGRAKVEIMGSGDVDLGQGARCDVTKMGSGNVRCGG